MKIFCVNKALFLKEIKEYLSILVFVIFIISIFGNNMSFADDCDKYGSNRCRNNDITVSSQNDSDGNRIVNCNDIDLVKFNFPSEDNENGTDYDYTNKNLWCINFGLEVMGGYMISSIAASLACMICPSDEQIIMEEQKRKIYQRAQQQKQIWIQTLKQVIKTSAGKLVKIVATTAFGIIMTTPSSFLKINYIADSVFFSYYVLKNTRNALKSGYAGALCAGYAAACLGSEAAVTLVYEKIFDSVELILKNFSKAEEYVNSIKMCGYNWNNFAYTPQVMETSANKDKWYPRKGAFSGSYQHKLINCFNNLENAEKKYGTGYCDEVKYNTTSASEKTISLCSEGSGIVCDDVTISSRTLRNRAYRELLYGGKEFSINTDNNCYDPRLYRNRGYTGEEQRYYFKGDSAAVYACDRFIYQKNTGCILSDGTIITRDEIIDEANKKMTTKLTQCEQAFSSAYSCCTQRMLKGACIYDIEENDRRGVEVIANNADEDNNDDVKSLGKGRFIAYESDNLICVKNVNYCPYRFNISGGTSTKVLYCEGKGENCDVSSDLDDIYLNSSKTRRSTKYGQIKNFCFYNANCTVPGTNSTSKNDMENQLFLSLACTNLVGDSQNLPAVEDNYGNLIYRPKLGVNFSLSQYRGITAPIAQCFKETFYNLFMNRAGRSECKCTDSYCEKINDEGLCGVDTYGPPESIRNGVYEYKVGDTLPDSYNIFLKIQNYMRYLIKIAATLAIFIMGLLFLKKGETDIIDLKSPRKMVLEIAKFALVFYFAVGEAWQTQFYKWLNSSTEYVYYKVYNLSSIGYQNYRTPLCTISNETGTSCECRQNDDGSYSQTETSCKCYDNNGNITKSCPKASDQVVYARKYNSYSGDNGIKYKVEAYKYSNTYDGCYFGDNEYPEGKQYLSIFDSFDCKLARYFGYGPEVSLPGIINAAIISLLFSYVGVIILFLSFVLFVFVLRIVIQALYFFLLPMIAINIIIFLSPVIIPLMLFSKYKSIFTKFIDSLIGYTLQFIFAIILAAFILSTFDNIFLGSAKYKDHDNNGRFPKLDCSSLSKFDSLYCIFDINTSGGTEIWPSENFYRYTGIGVNVPIVTTAWSKIAAFFSYNSSTSVNSYDDVTQIVGDYAVNKVSMFTNFILLLLKASLISYILSKLFDQIPMISMAIAGAKKLDRNVNIGKSTISTGIKDIKIGARVAKSPIKSMYNRAKGSFGK